MAAKWPSTVFKQICDKKQNKIWGVRLLTSILLETPDSPDSGDIETVDIRELLQPRVISYMTRKDKTRFKVIK